MVHEILSVTNSSSKSSPVNIWPRGEDFHLQLYQSGCSQDSRVKVWWELHPLFSSSFQPSRMTKRSTDNSAPQALCGVALCTQPAPSAISTVLLACSDIKVWLTMSPGAQWQEGSSKGAGDTEPRGHSDVGGSLLKMASFNECAVRNQLLEQPGQGRSSAGRCKLSGSCCPMGGPTSPQASKTPVPGTTGVTQPVQGSWVF